MNEGLTGLERHEGEQGRHALIIFEGAQVGRLGGLMFYLFFPLLGYSKYSQ